MKPKRTYGKLTERAILELIREGVLIVDLAEGHVYTKHPVRNFAPVPEEPRLVPEFLDKKQKYLFVRIYFKGRRKAVAINRIVWMAGHNRTIPDGYEVHHNDTIKTNNRFGNLDAVDSITHRSYNGKMNAAKNHGADYPDTWDTVELDPFDEDAEAADAEFVYD